jgi:hypothetical protein
MKLKYIAAACVAVCSTGAFAAATPIVCSKTSLTGLVQTCAPEVTFYVGGASAQAGAMSAILESGTGGGIFDTTQPRGKIALMSPNVSGLNGVATTDVTKTNTIGYIGIGAADAGVAMAGKIVLVIYNKANGSFAGVNQLLTGKGGNLEEVTLQTSSFKALAKGTGNQGGCSITADSAAGAPSALGTATCTNAVAFSSAWGADAQKKMHMALADVRPNEASPGVVKSWKPASFPAQTTGMQGFGVIVNPNLYTALITKEIAAGRLPSSCATSEVVSGATYTTTAACVPNLSRAEYASIITGKITTADQLLGTTGDTKLIKLARRTASSGTQAASNIYFANQQGYNAKLTTDGADSYADVKAAGTYGSLVVTEGTATGDVITAVSGETTDYALGVVSVENTYSNTKTSGKLKGALFVKLENVSPIHKGDGTIDAKARAGMLNGYPFAFQMQALKSATLADPYLTIYNKIVLALTDPSKDLAGIAYIGSGDATKDTTYTRFTDAAVTGGNYLPLRKN